MNVFHIVLPILVGAVIGYCTNYIAIKMLFHPKKAIYIGKWRVPFTPGAIPKNHQRLAHAVASAVCERLVKKEDMIQKIKNNDTKNAFVNSVKELILKPKDSLNSGISELVLPLTETAPGYITNVILKEAEETNFLPAIRTIGNDAMRGFMQNPMIAMFLNEAVLETIYINVDASIHNFIEADGEALINSFIQNKINEIKEKPIEQTLQDFNITEEHISEIIGKGYDLFIESCGESLIGKIDLYGIIEENMQAMNVDELEELVMSVMKHELQMVINLGALIGAVIGTVNIFI